MDLPNKHDIASAIEDPDYCLSSADGWSLLNSKRRSALENTVAYLADAPDDMTAGEIRAALLADDDTLGTAAALARYKSKG